jgi:monoterpene epsilon-lactone hydrolase
MSSGKTGRSAEAQAFFEEFSGVKLKTPDVENLHQYRIDSREDFEPYIQRALNRYQVDIEDIQINGIPCKQITAPGWSPKDGLCIQYAYGGGAVAGSPYEDQIVTIPLAQFSNTRIVSVDYRLAPEHPYPAATQDMARVYDALLDRYGADRLAVCGESAGGNLTLALLLHLRDQKLAMPRCAALLSPWCDLSSQGDSHLFNDNRDPTLNNEWVDLAAALYANGRPLDDPGISPLFAEMNDLPPTIITTGSCDLLLSGCLRLARKMRAANVPCDLRVWEGMWHVFEFYNDLPESEQSIIEIAEFIRAHY